MQRGYDAGRSPVKHGALASGRERVYAGLVATIRREPGLGIPPSLRTAADLVLAAAVAVAALRLLVIGGYLCALTEGRLGAADLAILTAKPVFAAAGAVLLLLVRGWSWRSSGWVLRASGAAALALALWPARAQTETNAFGLASQAAGRTYEIDYSRDGGKREYPLCRFTNNTLGYRDVEPSFAPGRGQRRILVVGDSFVWGDGIPANEQTLGSLLRAELERLAPGRFVVMSAAYPGLGVYGYGRFIEELAPRFRPDVVVAGYLGENDEDPADPQFLLDRLPRLRPARNLILNLRAGQDFHEASVGHAARIWSSAANKGYFAGLLRAMARRAAERGYRLVFLSYFPHPALPAPIEALDLPPELRYPGRANALWYGEAFHPKPALNRILARTLAAKLVGNSKGAGSFARVRP